MLISGAQMYFVVYDGGLQHSGARPNSTSNDLLQRTSEKASGDARIALLIQKSAAKRAQPRGHPKITLERIEQASKGVSRPSPRLKMTPIATDYAWLAGIIDGEGSIYISKTKVEGNRRGFQYRPILSISNTNRLLINRVKEIAECGSISEIKEHRQLWKDKLQYIANASGLRLTILKVLPYLIAKRLQAELMIEFLALIGSQGQKVNYSGRIDEIYVKMKLANMKSKPTISAYIAIESVPDIMLTEYRLNKTNPEAAHNDKGQGVSTLKNTGRRGLAT